MGWSSQVVVASQVIIEGSDSGLFVYAGVPGPGTLIVSAAAQAGTDPYGNAYPQGLKVTQGTITGTTFNGLDFIINSAGFFFYTGVPALGNLIQSITNANGTDQFGNNYVGGIYQASNDSTSWVQLFNGVLSLQSSAPFFRRCQMNADQWLSPAGNGNGGTLLAQDPAIGNAESWHSLGSPGATGFLVNSCRYRLTADGLHTEYDIQMHAGVAGGTAGVYTFATTPIAAYQWAGNTQRVYPLGFNNTITTGANNAILSVDGNGTATPGRVQIRLPALGANTIIGGTCLVPLS